MTRKVTAVVLLTLVLAVLLAAGAPLLADGCNPTAGDACVMPDHTRWAATDIDYLPLVVGPVAEKEMARP